MRMLPRGVRIVLVLLVVLSTGLAAYGQKQPPAPQPLSMRDIARMHHERVAVDTIVERVTEQGVSFTVTPGIEKQLVRLGFQSEQIDAIRQASEPRPKEAQNAPAIEPGKELPSGEEERKKVLDQVTKITKLSGANVQPAATRHLTLWAAKDDQVRFLPDIKKIESFLESKCTEPLRSGLDKRAAHLILLKTRYDYEKWVNAMFEVMPHEFELPGAPGGNADLKAAMLKWSGYYSRNFAVLCMAEQEEEWLHRLAAADVGYMNFVQQVEPGRHDPLSTGFANCCESLLFESPNVMLFSNSYHNEDRDLGNDPRAWLHLVQDRMRTKKATGVRALLGMDTSTMLLPHYAEAWTLAGVLARQPEKFGKLLLALRQEKDALKAIEQVYGWDEKKLEEQWYKEVLKQR